MRYRVRFDFARNPAWAELALASRDLIDLEPYRAAWTKFPGIFLNEYGGQPRVPLPVQLVRKADFRQQIPSTFRRRCR